MPEPEKERPSGLVVDVLRGAKHTPATFTICAAAIVLSIAGWSKIGLEPFVLDRRAFADEPWRLLSAHFVHANVLHLFFNLSWIWGLGRVIEARLGEFMLLTTSLIMMLATSAAVHAFDRGGIGLSGVVYGMWAFVFVGQRFCDRLQGILNARINRLMVIWFFFCIFATVTGMLPISNWGHGAGAVSGALLGLGINREGRLRRVTAPVGIALVGLLFLGATIWWPAWNFGGAALECEREADAALGRSDWPAAEQALRTQLRLDADDERARWNLGVVLSTQGREPEALECWRELERRATSLGDKEWSERARSALGKLPEKR